MKRSLTSAAVIVLLVLSHFNARAQDDQYLRIYSEIQAGDAARNANDPALALTKYLSAQSALQKLQRVNPEWNTRVVSYRMNYLATRISEVSAKAPIVAAAPSAGGTTNSVASARPSTSTNPELQTLLASLRGQVQQLQSDNTVLEAKLKEALAAQPAAVDPRELAKAEERIEMLQKENDLLKVSMFQEGRPIVAADTNAIEQMRQELNEANRQSAAQAELAKSLAAEKEALQNKLDSMIKSEWNAANVEAVQKALEESNQKLATQTDAANRLSSEKQALEERLKALADEAEAAEALRAENEILKKQVAELKAAPAELADQATRELAEARAQIAALQSEKDILRLERIALEGRVKQLASQSVGSRALPAPSAYAERVTSLERERDALQKRLDAANRELNERSTAGSSGRVSELSGQLTVLRGRLDVLEAQKIPYTEEELALFRKPATPLDEAKSRGKSIRELPPGAAALVAEAQRDFSARRFDRAEQKYLQILQKDDRNPTTLANLAAIQLEMNRLEDAEKNIRRAVELAPEDAYSHSILGNLKFRQGKYDDALDALSQAAKLDPQNPEIQNYLGLTLSQKGMRGPAETALRRAVQLDPNYAGAHYNLAVIYVTQQPPAVELARLHYKKALSAGLPANADLERMLGPERPASAAR